MAYINRLSDINNKLDISIENQLDTNSKLANIDDNIETTRVLTNSINTNIITTNTNLDSVNENLISIDNNIDTTNTKLDTINTSVGTVNTSINTSIGTSNTTLSNINQGIGFNFQGNVYGNVCNNITINANSLSTAFTWTRGTYGRNSILSYYDASTANTDNISIFTTATNGTSLYLGTAYPINIGNVTGRHYCFTLNLLPYTSISIRNNSSSNITGVYATLTSS
jgi:hypothetical protein